MSIRPIAPPPRPQAVYDAILRNATSARAAPEGITSGIEGAAGGIPFPIPQDGAEAVWNHVLAFWGAARETRLATYVVFGAQPPELTDDRREVVDFPYYYPNATPASDRRLLPGTAGDDGWPARAAPAKPMSRCSR